MYWGHSVQLAATCMEHVWGAVAQWLERTTDDRVVAGSNPVEAAWKLCQFPLPHFASVFRMRDRRDHWIPTQGVNV